MNAPLHIQERARFSALKRYNLLDTQPEAAFDGLARLAAYICTTATALITLVDADRLWFKALVGRDVTDVLDRYEAVPDASFCAHTILQSEILLVPDTHIDSRFVHNPFVIDAPFVRFYAGVPLITADGYTIGTLCVLDTVPCTLSAQQVEALYTVAQQVLDQLELKRSIVTLQRAMTQHDLAQVALQREIAEREQIEHALRESQTALEGHIAARTADLSAANTALAHAARLKDEFLASMSHELRTPLNAILGTYEALHEQLYGSLTSRQTTALEHIEASSRHLLALINDILDLSKIGAGKLELQIGSVPVADLCNTSVQLTRPQAQHTNVQIITRYDPCVTRIQGDVRRLKQVLINLLANAVKFTPAGGTVGLDVAGDATKNVAWFTVWDTGIGIAREDQARIFQPFTQLTSSQVRPYEGTGLGLALVANIVELHGGTIALQSAPDEGSRFTITLPWHEHEGTSRTMPDALTETTRAAVRADLGEQRVAGVHISDPCEQPLILIVEDNADIVPVLEAYLQAHLYRTAVARNGREAIAHAHAFRPAVIVMDIQMPDMDGLEATRRVRADDVLAGTPIIAVTALAMVGDRERCLAAGANAYMSKPVSLRALVDEIETHIAQAS